jgi:hypothetical protein
MATKVTTEQFVSAWNRCGGVPTSVANALGLSIGAVLHRRTRLERLQGLQLKSSHGTKRGTNGYGPHGWASEGHAYNPRINDTVKGGVVLVGSDAHYWPGLVSTAHKAFVALARELKPVAVVMNGDVFDGARISRHDPMGWQKLPDVVDELEAVKARLGEVERASPKARKYWTVGNHDSRFDRRLASETADFGGVEGFRLSDHFKQWQMSYSLMLNEDAGYPVMIRHAFRGGVHAVYNNTLHGGVSIVTGHLHAQLNRPITDYRGTRYGVDCGTLADIDGPQFSYTMDGPVNWRSGFAVLTFDKAGRLLPPELCEVQRFGKEQRAVFRGGVVAV